MEDKEFYDLSLEVSKISVSLTKDAKHIEHIISLLNKKIDDDYNAPKNQDNFSKDLIS